MAVDISSIKDATLRLAAESADLNDTVANYGKLNSEELSVFIKQAENLGCSKDSIVQLCHLVGIEQASADVKVYIDQFEQKHDNVKTLSQEDGNKVIKLTPRKKFVGAATILGALLCATGGPIFAVPGAVLGFFIGAWATMPKGRSDNNSAEIYNSEQQRPVVAGNDIELEC